MLTGQAGGDLLGGLTPGMSCSSPPPGTNASQNGRLGGGVLSRPSAREGPPRRPPSEHLVGPEGALQGAGRAF